MTETISRELLLDYPAFREGTFRLAEPAQIDDRPDTAEGWARAYGGMVSYESALDQAGYEYEREMDAPDAPILVMLCDITDDGAVRYTDFRPGVPINERKREITADEMLADSRIGARAEETPEP